MGRPGLSAGDQAKVRVGNSTMKFVVALLVACAESGTPCVVENPLASRLWHAPAMHRLLQKYFMHESILHQCQYGVRWRKATRLVHVHIPPSLREALELRCSGKRFCSASSKPHIQLSGVDPVSKMFWTTLSQSYPKRFARAIANSLFLSAENRALVRCHSLGCG